MPYPFEGRHFNYRDKNIPILGRSDVHFEFELNITIVTHQRLFRFNGNKDVVLHLPPGTTVDQLK